MKIFRYALALLLLVIMVSAGVVYFYIDAIAHKLADAVLREQGFEVQELVIDKVRPNSINVARLALLEDDNTRYTITDLTVPLGLLISGTGRITISEVHLVFDPESPDSFPTTLLENFLLLPVTFAGLEIMVDGFTTPGYPAVREIIWRSQAADQQVTFSVEAVKLRVATTGGGKDSHRIDVTAAINGVETNALFTAAKTDRGFSVDGNVRAQAGAWLALLQSSDVAPADLTLTGDLDLSVEMILLNDTVPFRVGIGLQTREVLALGHGISPDLKIQAEVRTGAPVMIDLGYPALDWTANAPSTSVVLSAGSLSRATGDIHDLTCSDDQRCDFTVAFDTGPVTTSQGSLHNARVDAALSVALGETISVHLAPATGLTLTGMTMAGLSAASARALLPAGGEWRGDVDGWQGTAERLDLSVSDLQSGDIRVHRATGQLASLDLRQGPDTLQAVMNLLLEAGPLTFAGGSIEGITCKTGLTLTQEDYLGLSFSPTTNCTTTGISSADLTIAAVSVTQPVASQMYLDEKGWQGRVPQLDLLIDRVSYEGRVQATLPVSLTALQLHDDFDRLETTFSIKPAKNAVVVSGISPVLPVMTGTISLHSDQITSTFNLSGNRDSVTAQGHVTHDLNTAVGALDIPAALLRFDRQKLSAWRSRWPHADDIVSGNVTAKLRATWQLGDDSAYTATANLKAEKLTGFYDTIAFTDMDSELAIDVHSSDTGTMFEIARSSLGIELLDVGVPVQKLRLNLTGNRQGVSVSDLAMSTLGGQIHADDFRIALPELTGEMTLRIQSIQLPFMIALAKFDDSIEASGSVSGVLPVMMGNNTVTINNGRVENDGPGVIRYLAAATGKVTSPVDIASRALGNFRFDTLTSTVKYNDVGDLKLQVRIRGINPDMDPLQPVILNLSLDNNVPQLLRSLQATRTVEDIVKKKASK